MLSYPKSHRRASESVNLVNDHDHVTDISENTEGYHCGTSLETIGGNLYKFRDDSVRPRRFLGTDHWSNDEVSGYDISVKYQKNIITRYGMIDHFKNNTHIKSRYVNDILLIFLKSISFKYQNNQIGH